MRSSLNCFRWMVILGISFFLLARDGWATVEILEPSVLRLETTTSPYSYRVIEKSAREVLRVQDNISFIIGDEAYPAAEATNVVEDAEGIHGNLIVESAGREQLPDGAPDRGQVSFTFLWPETLQIHITYNNASPSEVSEQFDDQGERYYGIWDYPFGGHKVNSNWDANWAGSWKSIFSRHPPGQASSNTLAVRACRRSWWERRPMESPSSSAI